MTEYSIGIGKAFLWVGVYFGMMLFYTFLDVAVWRKVVPKYSNIIHVITIAVCIAGFILLLKKSGYQIRLFTNLSFVGIVLAIGCAILFWIVLDKGLDPILERRFPQSEQDYQEAVQRLAKSPFTSLVQIAILAPVIEEILMRGVVLGGLKNNYGAAAALLISAVLFAVLHFNMVQTLSAFVCGIVLGLLYLKTNSICCCIIAHCGYNVLSYMTEVYPHLSEYPK